MDRTIFKYTFFITFYIFFLKYEMMRDEEKKVKNKTFNFKR
jgi:hypothetical protein